MATNASRPKTWQGSPPNWAMVEPTTDPAWGPLFRVGALAALVGALAIVIAIPVFIVHPPPASVLGLFADLQRNRLLGLMDLDLAMVVAEVFTAVLVLAIFVALRQRAPSAMAIATMLGLLGIADLLAVNPAFAMLSLSDQYAAATTEAQRAVALVAGQALWANYQGTAFDVGYVLTALWASIASMVMLLKGGFGRATASIGILTGTSMLVPPTAGRVGIVLSLAAVALSLVWYLLLAHRLWQLGQPIPGPTGDHGPHG